MKLQGKSEKGEKKREKEAIALKTARPPHLCTLEERLPIGRGVELHNIYPCNSASLPRKRLNNECIIGRAKSRERESDFPGKQFMPCYLY